VTGSGGGPVEIRVPKRLRVVGPPSWNEGTSPEPSVDELDIRLMALVVEDSRATNRALGAALGVTEVTVAHRLRRLVSDHILIFTALLDWEAVGYEWLAIARIRVVNAESSRVARDVSALRACTSVATVSGSCDVQATFLLPDRASLHRLKESEVASVDGIAEMSLHLATRSYMSARVRSSFMARRVSNLWLPAPRIPLDAIDVGIIEALIADGRRPSRQIGRDLNVSEGTIRARRARLEQAGIMRVEAMRNPLAFGQVGALGQVGLRVHNHAIATVTSHLRQVPAIVQVVATVGTYDLMVAIAALSKAELATAIHDEIRSLDGVHDIDTLEVEEVVHFVPFLKQLNT
jgi:DNA-binding Lrp family transcriptional regulator